MSEAEKIDRAARRREAEARLARSRPAREAAAAAHAECLSGRAPMAGGDTKPAAASPNQSPDLSGLERKILDAANDILVSRGDEGRRLAKLIRKFVGVRMER